MAELLYGTAAGELCQCEDRCKGHEDPAPATATYRPRNANESLLLHLKWLADFELKCNDKRPGPNYALLKRGQLWTAQRKPREYPYGPWKHCFQTAYRAANAYGLRYVEGMALHIIPTHHAWNVDDDGNVIDLTWRTTGPKATTPVNEMAYFGVEVPMDDLNDVLAGTLTYGALFKHGGYLDDDIDRLREEHHANPFTLSLPELDALEQASLERTPD